MTGSLLPFVLTCAGLRLLSCQDNNVCIRLRRIRAKTQLSRLANCRCQGGVQLWVTAAVRLLPPPVPVGQPSAGVSAAAAPRPPCPGAFTARSVASASAGAILG